MDMVQFKAFRTATKHAIPHLFTFANASFGFLSVVNAMEGNYRVAAYCIFAAFATDVIDGRLARAFGSSSGFGMELDSLCDAVSFCFAPVILIYSCFWSTSHAAYFLVLAFYLCAGLARLARFNLSNGAQMVSFSGLATPVSALLLVHLVLYDAWFSSHIFGWFISDIGLAIFVTSLALLMISPIPFYSFKLIRKRRKPSWLVLFGAVASVTVAMVMLHSYVMRNKIDRALAQSISGFPIIFFGLAAYVLIGVGLYVIRALFPNRSETQ